MGEEEKARRELGELKKEHQQIEDRIATVTAKAVFDQLLVQRLKRQKLTIKDRISVLQEFLCEDIIA